MEIAQGIGRVSACGTDALGPWVRTVLHMRGRAATRDARRDRSARAPTVADLPGLEP